MPLRSSTRPVSPVGVTRTRPGSVPTTRVYRDQMAFFISRSLSRSPAEAERDESPIPETQIPETQIPETQIPETRPGYLLDGEF